MLVRTLYVARIRLTLRSLPDFGYAATPKTNRDTYSIPYVIGMQYIRVNTSNIVHTRLSRDGRKQIGKEIK